MTNFGVNESMKIWNSMASYTNGKWNVRRGRWCYFPAKDVLIMTRTTLKHGGLRDFIARMLNLKGLSFEKMIVQFLQTEAQDLYGGYVKESEESYHMYWLLDLKKVF